EALLLAAVGASAARCLLDDPAASEADAPPAFALPTRPVLLIGLIGLCAVFGEVAGTDWSALYIRTELGGSAGTAAFAVSAFAVTMAVARLIRDRVIRGLGPGRTVRLSGACAARGAGTGGRGPRPAFGAAGCAR